MKCIQFVNRHYLPFLDSQFSDNVKALQKASTVMAAIDTMEHEMIRISFGVDSKAKPIYRSSKRKTGSYQIGGIRDVYLIVLLYAAV